MERRKPTPRPADGQIDSCIVRVKGLEGRTVIISGDPNLLVINLIKGIPLMIHGRPRRYVFRIDSLSSDLGCTRRHVLPASERSRASRIKVYWNQATLPRKHTGLRVVRG